MHKLSLRRYPGLFVAGVLVLVSPGCASSKFKHAKNINSVGAHDTSLAQYGDSAYGDKARRLREISAYRDATYRGTIASYQDFLHEYQVGPYARKAREEIARINAEMEMEQAICGRIRGSNSASEQAMILAYASGSLEGRLRRNDYLKPYFDVLDRLRLTKRDIVVTVKTSECQDAPILGSLCTEYLYAGKILRNDIVYFDQGTVNRIRTIHRAKDLLKVARDSGDHEFSGWFGLMKKEAFGDTRDFKREQNLTDRDLYHSDFRVHIAESFYPTTFSSESTSASGGILGFIQDHPVASLIIGAAIVSALDHHANTSSSRPESTTSTRASSSNSTGLGKLLSCASQAVAGKLIENPAAAGAISEAIRSGLEGGNYSLRSASTAAATNYVVDKLRGEGHEDAARLVETGDFLLCAIGGQ